MRRTRELLTQRTELLNKLEASILPFKILMTTVIPLGLKSR